jgi:hypothetical protein
LRRSSGASFISPGRYEEWSQNLAHCKQVPEAPPRSEAQANKVLREQHVRPIRLEFIPEQHPSALWRVGPSWRRPVPQPLLSAVLRGFTGQEEGLLLPLREVTVVIGLAQQPGAHFQPGLVQPLRDPLRRPPTEVERNRVTQRF